MSRFKLALLLFVFSIVLVIGKPVSALSYTAAEVAQHNTASDCWMIFTAKIYDLSSYLKNHDRYLDIRSWCGQDMTEAFTTKDGTGRDHKTSSYSLLENYYFADLASVSQPTAAVVTTSLPATVEEDEYAVEIEGQDMKLLTIKEIADLWQIDAAKLLTEIRAKFNLQGTYTIDSVLEDLRAEYKFSPAQIKDIAEAIKNGMLTPVVSEVVSGEVVNKAAAKNPYDFWLPVLTTTVLYLLTYFVSRQQTSPRAVFSRANFNLFWNSILLISLIPSALFGIYLIARYSFPELYRIEFDFLYWHVEGSLVFATVAILHLIQRIKQYLAPLKLWRRRVTPS